MEKININNYQFWMETYLYNNLQVILKKAIPNKWDGLLIVHGKEGSGKSYLTSQLGIVLDNNMTLEFWAWAAEQFKQKVEEAPPESTIIWDEAVTGATATAWAQEISQLIIRLLTQIRKKRLKIIICFPYLHLLNKYFVSRCIGSIWVHAYSFTNRGHGRFYNQKQTEFAYGLIKEKYRLRPFEGLKKARYSFSFRFPNRLCVPELDYERLKDEGRLMAEASSVDKWKQHAINMVRYVRDTAKIGHVGSISDMAKAIGVTPSHLYRIAKETTVREYSNNNLPRIEG